MLHPKGPFVIAPQPGGRGPLVESSCRALHVAQDATESAGSCIYDAIKALDPASTVSAASINQALGALVSFDADMERLRQHVHAARTVLMLARDRA